MKYRKKPVGIEAARVPAPLEGEDAPDGLIEAHGALAAWLSIKAPKASWKVANSKGEIDIETLEGTHRARNGDYIIVGVRGELYPCKPEIFEETYEAVE